MTKEQKLPETDTDKLKALSRNVKAISQRIENKRKEPAENVKNRRGSATRKILVDQLATMKKHKQQEEIYNHFSLLEKRLCRAFIEWYKTQKKPIPSGTLEMFFKDNSFVKEHFSEEIKRKKSRKNVYVFIFERGKPHASFSPEVANVLAYFNAFYQGEK